MVFQIGKRGLKRWAWGLLGPVLIPALLITLGAFAVVTALGVITNAGVSSALRQDADAYKAVAVWVNPPEVEESQKLTWGILKASEFILGSDKDLGVLATRLAPKVAYDTFTATITKTGPDGKETTETVSFRLLSEIRTYNAVYSYGYEFTEDDGEVAPRRRETGRLVDRSVLYETLSWYAGAEVDPMTANIVEQTALSFDTGKASWAWLEGSGALEGETAVFPVAGVVTSGFGYRIHPISGFLEYHPGIDIAAEEGTPIPSMEAGKVVSAGYHGGYGLCVVIDHGSFLSVYGHVSKVFATVGQAVRPGEFIAEVGSNGLSTGPHLHFEVRQHGGPVDPAPWMR